MRKLRVLEMIDKPFLGGGQIHLLSLARGLDKDRFEVIDRRLRPAARSRTKPGAGGFGSCPLPSAKDSAGGRSGRSPRILKENGIDILHTHGGVAGFFGRRAAGTSRNARRRPYAPWHPLSPLSQSAPEISLCPPRAVFLPADRCRHFRFRSGLPGGKKMEVGLAGSKPAHPERRGPQPTRCGIANRAYGWESSGRLSA